MKISFVLGCAAIVLPSLSVAQSANEAITLTYGAGIVGTSGNYVGQDDDLLPFPILTATYGNWTADVTRGVRYTALSTDRTRLAVGLGYNFAPDMPDTALFDGLDRDGNAELVASVYHRFDQFDIGAEIGADVSSVHDGVRADVSVGRSVSVGLFQIEGRLGVEYLDANFAAHLFGVGKNEATSARAAYSPGETWTPHIELSAALPFENGTIIVGFFEYRRLPGAVGDSPLEAERDQTSIGISFMRSF